MRGIFEKAKRDAKLLNADIVYNLAETPQYFGEVTCIYFMQGLNEVAHYAPTTLAGVCMGMNAFDDLVPIPYKRHWSQSVKDKYSYIPVASYSEY
jgi:hypothetical protein